MKKIYLICIIFSSFILKSCLNAFEISASASPLSGSGIVLVNFTGSAVGDDGSYSYSWDFDDSDGIDVDKFQQNPSFVCAYPGEYTSTLTVTNRYGDAKIETVNITVNPGVYKDTTGLVFKNIH